MNDLHGHELVEYNHERLGLIQVRLSGRPDECPHLFKGADTATRLELLIVPRLIVRVVSHEPELVAQEEQR